MTKAKFIFNLIFLLSTSAATRHSVETKNIYEAVITMKHLDFA